MKILNSIFISIFILILFSQFLIDVVEISALPITKNKKKVYAQFTFKAEEKEKFSTFQKVKRVKSNLEKFYANNLAFKPLFKQFISIKHNIFDIKNPMAGRVIEGSEGWYFLGNFYSEVIDEYKGYLLFTDQELDQLEHNLESAQRAMEKKNIKIYFTIAPNKHTMYNEFLPVKKYKDETKMQQLTKRLKKNKAVNFINLYPTLKKNKPKNLLYYKNDSHWNFYGAYIAYRQIMKTIKKDFKNLSFLQEKDLLLKNSIKRNGGNTRMLGIKIPETVNEYRVKKYKSKVLDKQLPVPKDYDRVPNRYERRYACKGKKLDVLFFQDSFGNFVRPFMRENFAHLTCLVTYKYDNAIIEREKPDIIVIELVERVVDEWLLMDIK